MTFILLTQINGREVYVAPAEIAAIVGCSKGQSVLYLKGHSTCITVLGTPKEIGQILDQPPQPFQPPTSPEGGAT